MAIKPLENQNRALFIKISLLILVIAIGFTVDRIIVNGKNQKKSEAVLAADTEKNLQNNLPSVQDLANNALGQSQKFAGQVLGEAVDAVEGLASKSASTVSNFVIDSATGPIVDQIKKLPQSQQDEIKKNICN